jgi:hypothetical protein
VIPTKKQAPVKPKLRYLPGMARAAALVDDLMFLSRIQEAARAAGQSVVAVRTVASLQAALADGASVVFLDLDAGRLPVAEALALLRDEGAAVTIGFYGHVHAERAEAARAAGCTHVLARSAFVRELPGLLAGRE